MGYIITPEDIEESARIWTEIDHENATRPRVQPRMEEEPTKPVRKHGGTNAALAKGWHVDYEDSPPPPHGGICDCWKRKRKGMPACPCTCHGYSNGSIPAQLDIDPLFLR